jgi:hypothetical protein
MKTVNRPPIEANLVEIATGVYYPVRLYAVPRVGELVELLSFIEAADNRPRQMRYQVVQVVHNLYDAAGDASAKGHATGLHFVTVFVKRSVSKFFGVGQNPQLSARN